MEELKVNNSPINVHVDNYTGEKPIVIVYREDNPAEHLAPIPVKLPESIEICGTIATVYEWLSKRKQYISIDNCRLIVDRENANMQLVVNETNSRSAYTEDQLADMAIDELNIRYAPKSSIEGRIEFTDMYNKLNINKDAFWSPVKLAKFLRLNRVIFADKEEGMALVSVLKNVKAKINADYEKKKELHGQISKTEYFSQEVTHNLPQSFTVELAIFKGSPKEKYEIEIDADIVDGEIMVQLLSPAVNEDVENARDTLINCELAKIKTICPELVIVEI